MLTPHPHTLPPTYTCTHTNRLANFGGLLLDLIQTVCAEIVHEACMATHRAGHNMVLDWRGGGKVGQGGKRGERGKEYLKSLEREIQGEKKRNEKREKTKKDQYLSYHP